MWHQICNSVRWGLHIRREAAGWVGVLVVPLGSGRAHRIYLLGSVLVFNEAVDQPALPHPRGVGKVGEGPRWFSRRGCGSLSFPRLSRAGPYRRRPDPPQPPPSPPCSVTCPKGPFFPIRFPPIIAIGCIGPAANPQLARQPTADRPCTAAAAEPPAPPARSLSRAPNFKFHSGLYCSIFLHVSHLDPLPTVFCHVP